MKREITIDYGKFGKRTYTVGNLYTVHTWNKKYVFRLVNINENAAGIYWAKLTTKTGKMYDARAYELEEYVPVKRKEFKWRNPGRFSR